MLSSDWASHRTATAASGRDEDMLSAIARDYLETIYNVTMEGDAVVGARLAEKFGVSPASVAEMLQRADTRRGRDQAAAGPGACSHRVGIQARGGGGQGQMRAQSTLRRAGHDES